MRSVGGRNKVVCAVSASAEISKLLCCRLFVCCVAVPALDTGNWIFLRLIQVRQSVCTKRDAVSTGLSLEIKEEKIVEQCWFPQGPPDFWRTGTGAAANGCEHGDSVPNQ